MLKRQVRIIAWDDCAFRFNQKSVQLVGVVFRGGDFIDGLLSTVVKKDGTDATKKIAQSITNSRHFDQLSYIMTDGITVAGMNIIDIADLYEQTRLPVIAIVRKQPDRAAFIAALKKLPGGLKKVKTVQKTPDVLQYREIFFQQAGMTRTGCENLLDLTCIRSKIPEPLRVAHIIASGLSGESRGRA